MTKKKPILITGAHRSGTTWIGRVLKSSNELYYVHEPFNIQNKRGFSPFKYWFHYLNSNSPNLLQENTLKYLKSLYSIKGSGFCKELFRVSTVKGLYKLIKDRNNRRIKRPLLKDPIALMSTIWIYENLNCFVIIAIRHPAAFVASIKLKNWKFDFKNFSEQKELMDGYLKPYQEKIRDFTENEHSIIEQGILLWNCIYSIVYNFRQAKSENEDWLFVKHETLSKNTIDEFKKIFSFSQLTFSENVKNKIIETTQPKFESEHERDVLKNIKSWKQRLTQNEISHIKEQTFDVWKHFYVEKDWE